MILQNFEMLGRIMGATHGFIWESQRLLSSLKTVLHRLELRC